MPGRRSPPMPEGNFVVVWHSEQLPGIDLHVFGQRLDATGAPLGGEFRVGCIDIWARSGPSVATAPDGDLRGRLGPVVRLPAGATAITRLGRFASDLIFRDEFETGMLGAWSASAVDGGDLSVSAEAALGSTAMGLKGVVDDTARALRAERRPQRRRPLPGAVPHRPERVRPGRGEWPAPHAHADRVLGGAEPAHRGGRPAADQRTSSASAAGRVTTTTRSRTPASPRYPTIPTC